MKADTEMRRTPLSISRSATRFSSEASFGEWMRFTPTAPRPQRGAERLHRGLDPGEAQARGAEEAEHPAPAHGHDHLHGGNAVGHLAGDVGKRTPCTSQNERSPSHSGNSGGSEATSVYSPARRSPGSSSPPRPGRSARTPRRAPRATTLDNALSPRPSPQGELRRAPLSVPSTDCRHFRGRAPSGVWRAAIECEVECSTRGAASLQYRSLVTNGIVTRGPDRENKAERRERNIPVNPRYFSMMPRVRWPKRPFFEMTSL